MDTFRKWLNKPKADDKSLLARFYHADRSLTAVASELDSFDGRAEPDRCSRLVSRLRQGQDKVLAITNLIMEELLGEDRDPRGFRAKFPEEVLQENLAGQLWFGAECLAAGSSIMNREQESKEMRPLAQAVTKSLGNVRNLLRDQCLRNNVPNSKTLHLDLNDSTTEQLYESLKIFDRLFAEFELRYVSAMVQVKSKHEYETQELICVLFSETLQRALKIGLLDQDKVDAFDPALMFSIPRLAIISGLVIYPRGPLNMDVAADELSEMFRPFRTILIKIRDLLKSLNKQELSQLEKLLCTNEEIHLTVPVGTSSIEAPYSSQQNNNNNNNSTDCDEEDGTIATTNSTIEQRNNNNNNNNTNTSTDGSVEAQTTPSTSPKKNTLSTAQSASGYVTPHSPSISSVSAESSAATSPTASPSPPISPALSHSLVSTSSASSTSTNSPAEWSEDEENEDDSDDDADADDEMPKELDIVSADCATGYLIPNTNLGNLLQPQEVPLTDNFVASGDEFSNQEDMQDEDVPTTSAAVLAMNSNLRRLRLNDSSDGSEQLTIKGSSTKSLDSNETLSKASASEKASQHSSTSSSSSHRQRSQHDSSLIVSASAGSGDNNHSHRHHHRHSHGHGHRHHHSHHHHHHHHHHRSRSHHSKSKRCSVDGCQADADKDELGNLPSQRPTDVHHDTSSVDSYTSSSLSDGDPHEVSLALRAAWRMKFKSTESLLHRLFVCIAGVADQLQTNFASDLRQILRSVFLMNMSPAQEELDIPEKTKESELFEFRASENDVIQENAGSNQSIYSAEEVNPELDNVFNSSNGNGNGSGLRHSIGRTVQGSNSIDLGAADTTALSLSSGRNHIERSRSLGDQDNNEANGMGSSNNRRLSTYISGRRLSSPSRSHNGNAHIPQPQRNRNNSIGSNSPSSSSSESSSPPINERVSNGFSSSHSTRTALAGSADSSCSSSSSSSGNNNNNNNAEENNVAMPRSALASLPTNTMNSTPNTVANMRLSPPVWVPDDKAPRCMSCRTPFTAFRRRHHCRNCGGVFCGVCSNASAPLPKFGLTKAVRVCRDCYVREVLVSTVRSSTTTRTHAQATTAGGS